jgi:GDP-4-dehydro-6-deoxy-D-mannose reductase
MSASPTLVTGAAGFAGGHLLDRLADAGPIVGWCRPGGRTPSARRPVDWRAVELLDQAAVRAGLDEIAPSRIYHLAGAPSVDTSWQSVVPHLRANALGTHHLLEAVRRRGGPCRILVVTSAQIYEASDEPVSEHAPLRPPTPYGLSKLAQDQLAARAVTEDGLDVVIARPFNHAGPRQHPSFAVSSFARQIAQIELGLAPPVIRVGNLETRRDITDVRDVVDAYERLMAGAPPGRPYNICSGSAWRIGDLLEEFLHSALVPIRVEVDPARLRPSDAPVIQGDATRLRAELGWAPRITVEQMLRDTLEWWRGELSPAPDHA